MLAFQVYEACEALFASLADELKKHQDWLVLGDVAGDLDDFLEQQLCNSSGEPAGSNSGNSDVAEWELNLRMLKQAARDVDRMPNEVWVAAV